MIKKAASLLSVFCVLALLMVQGVPALTQDNTVMFNVGFTGFIRSAPSGFSSSIASVSDTQLPILALSPDENFYLVAYNGLLGWISSGQGEVADSLSTAPVLDIKQTKDTPDGIPVFTPETQVTLYQMHDDSTSIVAEPDGEAILMLGIFEDETFFAVAHEGQLGWLAMDELVGGVSSDLSTIPVIPVAHACIVQTDQARFASVRVGYGINRTPVTFLELEPSTRQSVKIVMMAAQHGSRWTKVLRPLAKACAAMWSGSRQSKLLQTAIALHSQS